MPTFKLTLAYDGTDFSGWQAQPDRRTVQGVVQTAWHAITGETVRMTAASRTDAGVHARGQVVGVESATHLDAPTLCRAVNARLPEDVRIESVELANNAFHATHDATGKRYRYQIDNARRRPIFDRRFVWHVPQTLEVSSMQSSAQSLVGTHDFASFQSAGSPRESTVRTIFAIDVQQNNRESLVTIEVEGDGFLYNMVRILVGTLIEVGLGRRSPDWVAEVLAACDRSAAAKTAPPQGLALLHVHYPS